MMYHDPRTPRRVQFERDQRETRRRDSAELAWLDRVQFERGQQELVDHPELDTDDRELDARREDA